MISAGMAQTINPFSCSNVGTQPQRFEMGRINFYEASIGFRIRGQDRLHRKDMARRVRRCQIGFLHAFVFGGDDMTASSDNSLRVDNEARTAIEVPFTAVRTLI